MATVNAMEILDKICKQKDLQKGIDLVDKLIIATDLKEEMVVEVMMTMMMMKKSVEDVTLIS